MKAVGKSIVNEVGRIVVIGDVHGCYREVQDMFDLLSITDDDTVVFVGDMVDRGDDSGKALDIAMKHHAVLGNHERHHLEQRETYAKNANSPHVSWHARTTEQLRPEHYAYMASLPHYIRLPQYGSVVVHAGAFPDVPFEQQSVRHLTSMQAIDPEQGRQSFWMGAPSPNTKSRPNEGYRFWTNFWRGPERVIFGHSVLNKPLVTDFVVGLDGGCPFGGGELWALVLPENKIYSVKSRQPYSGDWVGHEVDASLGVRTF